MNLTMEKLANMWQNMEQLFPDIKTGKLKWFYNNKNIYQGKDRKSMKKRYYEWCFVCLCQLYIFLTSCVLI